MRGSRSNQLMWVSYIYNFQKVVSASESWWWTAGGERDKQSGQRKTHPCIHEQGATRANIFRETSSHLNISVHLDVTLNCSVLRTNRISDWYRAFTHIRVFTQIRIQLTIQLFRSLRRFAFPRPRSRPGTPSPSWSPTPSATTTATGTNRTCTMPRTRLRANFVELHILLLEYRKPRKSMSTYVGATFCTVCFFSPSGLSRSNNGFFSILSNKEPGALDRRVILPGATGRGVS